MAGLYIHIPFCRSKCAYCDFYSGPLREFEAQRYVDALTAEFEARRAEIGCIETVYVGGGTPSSIDPMLLRGFCDLAEPGAEITIEVNPEDVDDRLAERALTAGFNRVSMGVQSLSDTELAAIGRRHNATKAMEAVATLRRSGFTNISLDLIYGLPGQTMESWRRSLDGVLSLNPAHLSAYMLSYEPGTRLYHAREQGKIAEADDDTLLAMYDRLCHTAASAGFEHYEISNFSRPGLRSRHNSSYWDFTPYLGLGPGAHSFDGLTRRFNPPSLHDYLKSPSAITQAEPPEPNARHNDLVITALRTSDGIDPSVFTPSELAIARRLLEETPQGRLRIAEPRWPEANSIMEELIRV